MIENLNARLGVVVGVILLAVIWVMPSFFDVGDEWWFSDKKIVYGLDIQGGLHLVMGVNVEEVLSESAKRLSKNLKRQLSEDGTQVESTSVNEQYELTVQLAPGASVEKAVELVEDNYAGVLQVLEEDTQSFTVRYYDNYLRDYRQKVVEEAKEVIRNRIDEFGVTEPSITAQGEDRILIQLPGIEDSQRAKQLIHKTARLEFKMVQEEPNPATLQLWIDEAEKKGEYSLETLSYSEYVDRINKDLKDKLPPETTVLFEKDENAASMEVAKIPYVLKDTDVSGESLDDAFVSFDEYGSPNVAFRMNPEGASAFAELTGANIGKRIAVVLDQVVKSAPVVQSKIAGSGTITLGGGRDRQKTLEEAKMISMALRAGSLPASLEPLEERTVGPTLGADSIAKGTRAGLVGGVLVLLFMLFYYKSFGAVANFALALNILMVLAALSSLGATLTLPGVAGIVLTIGMAVDANVIIFERIKEELAKGAGLQLAIQEGFGRAFSAIVDANLTTAGVCVVLMYYGTGPIRGFAVTLICGIVTSMFTAIFVTRTVLELLTQRFGVKKLSI